MVEFDAESILRLLTHYSDGELPLDATLKSAGVSKFLGRWIGLNVESKEWDGKVLPDGGIEPLFIRYEGKKVLIWGDKQSPMVWQEGVEAPKNQ